MKVNDKFRWKDGSNGKIYLFTIYDTVTTGGPLPLTELRVRSFTGRLMSFYENFLEMDPGFIEWTVKDGVPLKTMPPDMAVCLHDWQHYHGFTERYDYCSKCDLKRLMAG